MLKPGHLGVIADSTLLPALEFALDRADLFEGKALLTRALTDQSADR